MSKNSKTIYLDAPSLGPEDQESVKKALEAGFVSTFGPFVKEFEEKLSQYLDVEDVIATQSGTAALHVALHSLNLNSSDEVIVPALTFVASANAVSYTGAKVILADIDKRSWNIDLAQIEKKLSPNTKAILPVHLLGNPCQIKEIEAFAEKHKINVIYDSAESLGSEYLGKRNFNNNSISCFSFNGNKIITTGGGGLVAGPKEKLKRIKFLADQARDPNNKYYHSEVGFNYKMTNLEASLGLGQLSKLHTLLTKRQKHNAIYQEQLSEVEDIEFQLEDKDGKSSFWLTAVTFKSEEQMLKIQTALTKNQIQCRRMFTPLFMLPPYKDEAHQYPVASEIYQKSLCLPSSAVNETEDIHLVCETIKNELAK